MPGYNMDSFLEKENAYQPNVDKQILSINAVKHP